MLKRSGYFAIRRLAFAAFFDFLHTPSLLPIQLTPMADTPPEPLLPFSRYAMLACCHAADAAAITLRFLLDFHGAFLATASWLFSP